MFRAAQANPFDDAIVRATDENLTSENWELILDVCDKVGSQDTGGKDAVAALIKRLAHRNANVQLYTLELANALSQNCGVKIHKELASRSFTEALLRLANDRNTHQQVKAKILERMSEWSEMFANDPDLGIMDQAYVRLKSQNPSLQPPSKPFKREITDIDRQKEDDELQMALALSIKDKPASSSTDVQTSETTQSPIHHTNTQSLPQGTTAATVSRVRALYDFQPSEPGELQFRKGDIIAVLESVYKDWWKGSLRGTTGIFPLNYVEKLQDPSHEEVQREAQVEAEVFAEIKNVEKLLTLLSTSTSDMSVRDNEEITGLYHQTLAIRPKLIELIGKYSQKKDDFTQLNERFIKARRDYEGLLDASMSQPSQSGYARPPQQNNYAYPPQQTQPYAQQAPPAAQDPARFYQEPQSLQQQQSGPAPFYMIPPGQQPHSPSIQAASTLDHAGKPMSPIPGRPVQQQAGHGNPQELAANQFEPPPLHPRQPVSYQQQPSQQQYPPPVAQDLYATGRSQSPQQLHQQNTGASQQYRQDSLDSTYSYASAPAQPSYAAPSVPGVPHAVSPPPLHSSARPPSDGGYPALAQPPAVQPATQQYQAYQAYQTSAPAVAGPAGGGQDDASDYYR